MIVWRIVIIISSTWCMFQPKKLRRISHFWKVGFNSLWLIKKPFKYTRQYTYKIVFWKCLIPMEQCSLNLKLIITQKCYSKAINSDKWTKINELHFDGLRVSVQITHVELVDCSCLFVGLMLDDENEFELHGHTNVITEKVLKIQCSTGSDQKKIKLIATM